MNPDNKDHYFEDEGGAPYHPGVEGETSGAFYPDDQYPSEQGFDYPDQQGGDHDFYSESQDLTSASGVPDVLQLLQLCANGQAPTGHTDEALAEADESWEPVREWLRSHTAEEVRQATEQRDDSSRTALHLACRNQPPIDVINVFLSIAVEAVEWPDTFGWLPINYAAACMAEASVIKALTELFPKSKTTVDSRGRTPLHLVLGNGNRQNEMMAAHTVVAILSSSGAATYADFNGMLPLHYACAYGASEEALYVLTSAHYEGIRACDRNNRTPLHFALSNAGREAAPTAVKHLLELDPDLVNGNEDGSLPLRVLADFAHKFRSQGSDSTRESVQLCLKHLLKANPHPSADFFTALQSLPVWLSEEAVIMPNVQHLLNNKISQRFPTAILLLDFYMLIVIFVFYSWNTVLSIEKVAGDKDNDFKIPPTKNMGLYVAIVYFILREMIQVISFISMSALNIWIFDLNSWVNVIFISLITYGTAAMQNGYSDVDLIRYTAVITVLFMWLKLFALLRQNLSVFAVFWGGMIYVLRKLVVFIVALVVLLIAFTMMFMTVKMGTDAHTENCPITSFPSSSPSAAPSSGIHVEPDYCAFDPGFFYCDFGVAFLHLLTMLLGEVDDQEFLYPRGFETFIFILFMLLMVIILATVLIAIVTDSYKIIQTQRAAIVFWTNRLHVVAQVDAILNGNERVRAYLWVTFDTGLLALN